MISPFVGTGTQGTNGDNGPTSSAQVYDPTYVTVDRSGNLYFTDHNAIRFVANSGGTGIVTTIAGNVLNTGYTGDQGPATSATLTQPSGIAVDGNGNFFIADTGNHVIRFVAQSTTKTITTFAGGATPSGTNGDGLVATSASLASPYAVALDQVGNLYIADTQNHVIRRVGTNNIITTFAGTIGQFFQHQLLYLHSPFLITSFPLINNTHPFNRYFLLTLFFVRDDGDDRRKYRRWWRSHQCSIVFALRNRC